MSEVEEMLAFYKLVKDNWNYVFEKQREIEEKLAAWERDAQYNVIDIHICSNCEGCKIKELKSHYPSSIYPPFDMYCHTLKRTVSPTGICVKWEEVIKDE